MHDLLQYVTMNLVSKEPYINHGMSDKSLLALVFVVTVLTSIYCIASCMVHYDSAGLTMPTAMHKGF